MRISYLVAGAAVALVTAPAAALAMPAAHHGHSHAGTITGRDVKNSSLTGADIKDGSLGWKDLNPSVRHQLGGTVGGLQFNTVTKVSIDPSSSDTDYQASVACPAGQTVVSGGAFAMLPGTALVGTYPGPTGSNSWTGRVTQPAALNETLTVQVWAICASDPA